MSAAIDELRALTFRSFDELLHGVTSLVYVDYPDHANVGDSAIALGALEYFRVRGIRVEDIMSIGTYRRSRIARTAAPIYAHGGGNLGGLYPIVETHRYEVARDTGERVIIQGPQSAHFVSDQASERFRLYLADRPGYRIGARDAQTVRTLEGMGVRPVFMPDSAHMLGPITLPPPSQEVTWICRRDGESATGTPPVGGVDWIQDYTAVALVTKLRTRLRKLGPMGTALAPSARAWKQIADRRVARGLLMVAAGERIVTDRLHVMILGLQAGREVIAVDNNYGKVHGYARAWLEGRGLPLTLAASFADARDLLG